MRSQNSANEIIPGHIDLDTIVDAVKAGVRMAGGTPIEFGVMGICDGIAMGHEGMKYSLASRELIADSIESMVLAHAFNGIVFVPNCDKIIPGMLMAAGRLNLPSIVISGGPMLAGNHNGQRVDLNSLFEGVGAVSAGKMNEAELKELEDTACPGCVMFRNVYGEYYELYDRSIRHGIAGEWYNSSSHLSQNQISQGGRDESYRIWSKKI